jgi:hypothetical protein
MQIRYSYVMQNFHRCMSNERVQHKLYFDVLHMLFMQVEQKLQ